jgi:ABC-type Fe3+-siderophore transport system permease subunit
MSGSWNQTHLTETYKSLITISVEALKMLALANGGAAVALLTYLGNLLSHGPSGRLPNLTGPLICYSVGLLLTVLAFLAAYITQLMLYGEEVARISGQPVRQQHRWVLRTGMVLTVLAAIAFGVGSVIAGRVLLQGS